MIKGGGGGEWRWASMSDHVGDGTWTITFRSNLLSEKVMLLQMLKSD